MRSPCLTILVTAAVAACSGAGEAPERSVPGAAAPPEAPAESYEVRTTVSVAPRALGGGGQITYRPGEVTLGEQVRNRTVLQGGLTDISNLSNVVGSVVDIRGAVVNGVCQRPQTVDIATVEPGRILKPDATVDTKALSQIWFSEIIDRQRSVEAGYLAFTAQMSQGDRAEVIIEDVASQSIANFDTSVDPARLKAAEGRPLPQGACGRYVITRVVGTSVKHRILYSRKLDAGIAAVFKIAGKDHYTYEKLRNDLIVAIQLQPLRHTTPAAPGVPSGMVRSPAPPTTLPVQ